MQAFTRHPMARMGIGSLAAFGLLATLVHLRVLADFDRTLMAWAQSARDCGAVTLGMGMSTVFAIEVCALLSSAVSLILWQRGFGWPWSLAPWAVYGSLFVEFGMKAWLNQPTPRDLPWPTGCGEMAYGLPLAVSSTHSFPSGYSTRMGFFLTLLVAAAFTRGRAVGALAAVLAIIAAAVLGWSRAYIGWHWPLDVVGGVLFGAGIAGITFAVVTTRTAGARSASTAGPPNEAARQRLSANAPPG